MKLGIVVCTYGSHDWEHRGHVLASNLARRHLTRSSDHGFFHIHGDDLAGARNRAAAEVPTQWLCYLDADDDIVDGYGDAMLVRIHQMSPSNALVQPSTEFRAPPGTELPSLDSMGLIPPHPGGITAGNHLIIGTAVRRQLVLDVGGWDPALPVLEDWDLWIRCVRAGAALVTQPDAVYIANITNEGRNLRLGPAERARWAKTIRARYR